jgi:hypothetical protein
MNSDDPPARVRIYQLGKPATRQAAPARAPAALPVAEKPAAAGAIFTAGGLPGLPATALSSAPVQIAGGPDVASPSALTRAEKTALGMLAKAAWRYHVEHEDPLAELAASSKTAAETEWRHAQVAEATAGHPLGQRRGIAELLRGHYRTVEAHFTARLGGDAAVVAGMVNTGGRKGDTTEDREQAVYLLKQACVRWSYPFPAYPLGIARRRLKRPQLTDLRHAPAGKLKQILFQINTNGKAKAEKAKH